MDRQRYWIRQVTGRVTGRAPCFDPCPRVGSDVPPMLPAAWQCDLATEELRWSAGVFELFGIARGSAIDRRSTLELYEAESRALLERLRSRALETCGSFTIEAQIRRLDGSARWMRLSADVQKRGGKAVLLYGTKQDITAEMTG